jgi:hypothetical protein
MSTSVQSPNAIDRLLIEGEIRRLLANYVHNLDDGKVDANADLLAAAKLKIVDTYVSGRDDVAHFLRTNLQYHADKTPRTWHSVSNVLVDIDSPESARSVCYFTVHQELPGLPLQPIVTGRYIDTFELYEGAWRFASREVQPRLFGDISHHVAAPAVTKAD